MSIKFYPRKVYKELKDHLKARQVTVITGMRRTGKTTLMKQLLGEVESENKLYLDLQSLSNIELFSEKNYDNIILQLKMRGLNTEQRLYIGLDEIQLFPQITGVIKYLYDHYDIKFIATGSSSYYLKNLFSESLSGRKHIVELYPLDFEEFLLFKEVKARRAADWQNSAFNPHEYERLHEYYEEFIEYGGFPEVVLTASGEEKKRLLNDILSSYINIDVKTLSDFKESGNIYALVKMLSARIGTRLDVAKLSRLTGMARATVSNYLDLFEKTYLISRVKVHTHNPDRELVKAQKLYFVDTGLVSILSEVGSGAKFENAVFSELKRAGELRYYSLKTGREIDFVFNGEIALEAKETPVEADAAELEALSKIAGLKKFILIGRYPSPKFSDYCWGGDIGSVSA